MRSFATALRALRRAPLLSFLSVTTIAFSLFAFGLFALVALNIRQALDSVEERVEIRAFLSNDAAMSKAAAIANEIDNFAEVEKVELVTRSEERRVGKECRSR